MIAIVNVGPYNDPDPWGWRDYELRINKDVIATFRHKRCEGLPMCLWKAMEAAKAVELEDVFGMDRIAGEKKRSKKRMSQANTFCPNGGAGVAVDREGFCLSCGATAVGPAVDQLFNDLADQLPPELPATNGCTEYNERIDTEW